MSKRKLSEVSDCLLFQDDIIVSMSGEESDGSLVDSSDSSFQSDKTVDDSDADPTFNPDVPSTSGCFTLQNPVITPRPNAGNLSSSDDEVEESPRPRLSKLAPLHTTATSVMRRSLFDDLLSSDDEIIQNPASDRVRPTRRRRRTVPRQIRGPRKPVDPESSWDEVNEDEDPGYQHNFQFAELDGPKHCPPPGSEPIEYLNLFITINLLGTFVRETNRYARNYLARNVVSPKSRLKDWKDVTLSEMKAFLSIVFNMGLNKKPSIESYWSTKHSQSTPWFGKLMSRNRFTMILKFLHIVDVSLLPKHGQPGYDPCGRFKPLIDHANRLFRHHYTPKQALSIDESLVGTKKRIGMTQYMPKKKHHRWGIKLWVLCDAITHYCVAFFPYKGAIYEDNASKERGLAHYVVKTLLDMGNYLRKGYHLFLDNFFTSIPLARYLYENMTLLTGTLRLDRRGVPRQLKGKYEVGKKVYVRKGPILQMAWREKKSNKSQFIVITTDGEAKTVRYTINRNGKLIIKQKPSIVHQYNRGMGGIDGTDQMLYTYLDERKCLKPWKKVIFNIIGRMMLNAYVLYKVSNEKPNSRYGFMTDVIDALAADELTGKSGNDGGGDGPGGKYGLEKLPEGKQKDCSACSGKKNPEGKRRRSSTVCMNCKVGVHPQCYHIHTCQ